MASKLEDYLKSFVLLLSFVIYPATIRAQVTDLPAGPYGGEFRDNSTGKVWLDYEITQTQTLSQKIAFLQNTPFRLATSAEIQSIAQASSLQDLATGPFGSCQFFAGSQRNTCKYGVFDDSATGTRPDLIGMMGTEQGSSSVITENDRTDDRGASFLGAWAIQRGPALRPGTDPYGADFDGDGKDEKIVWRPTEGNWYIRFSATDEMMVYQWGLKGDIPLVGDYDGDLIPDLVVWRPSNGYWHVKTSKSLYDRSQANVRQFGLPGDVPLKGDFDGDGKLDLAVWRPKEGKWYVLQSSNNQPVVTQWGLSKDIPVTGGRGP